MERAARLRFAVSPSLDDAFEKVDRRSKLHDKIELVGIVIIVQQPNNVGAARICEFCQNLHFPVQRAQHTLLEEVLADDLHCHFLLCSATGTKLYLPKLPASQHSISQEVLFLKGLSGRRGVLGEELWQDPQLW